MDWKSTQREIGICQMKKMKYVKSRGRFWNRDILEGALGLSRTSVSEATRKRLMVKCVK